MAAKVLAVLALLLAVAHAGYIGGYGGYGGGYYGGGHLIGAYSSESYIPGPTVVRSFSSIPVVKRTVIHSPGIVYGGPVIGGYGGYGGYGGHGYGGGIW